MSYAHLSFREHLGRIGIEDTLCVLLLSFFAMAGAIPGIAPNQASEMTNTPPTGMMTALGIGSQLLVNLVIVVLLLFHARKLWRWNTALQWNFGIILAALLSITWSQDPPLTLRRSLPFAVAALFGLYFAVRYTVRRQLQILWVTMVILAIASIALALLFPKIGLDASTGHTHDWQGVFTQKNACGRAMVLASVVAVSFAGWRAARMTSFLVFGAVLVMSGSRGAWMIELLLLSAWAALRAGQHLRRETRAVVLMASAGGLLLGGFLVLRFLPEITMLLGRDSTLSGRTAIWHQVWEAVLRHPVLGYGLAAFWRGLHGASFTAIVALHFVLFHAHNGFLEIWLELGALGLVLFLLSYLRAWRRILPQLLNAGGNSCLVWMTLFLLLIAVYNIDENTFLTTNGIFWVLYVSVLANIEIASRQERSSAMLISAAPLRPLYYRGAAQPTSSV